LDLSSYDSVMNFVKENKTAVFDSIINNADINPIRHLGEISESDMEETVSVNLLSPLRIIQGFSEGMKSRRQGRVVNVGSILSVVSKHGRGIYSATKRGLHGLTETFAIELAPYGILVNTVSPGFTATEMTYRNNTEKEIAAIKENIPLGRMADVKEIARIILFLGSYDNTYITGQNIAVDGGYTIQ
jgi:3-oxoacyl-[acyl-carrier protein] reductase